MVKTQRELVKILVVDDELGMRDLLSHELKAHGFSVVAAANGEDALAKIQKEKFHLVISDVKMPRMDGLKMLDAVKKMAPDIEVIMSTGYGTIEMAVSAMKKGAYDFVQKPFNVDEILALVEKALEKSELRALVALYESSRAIFSSIRLEEMLSIVAQLASQILKADDASIMTLGPDGHFEVVVAVGLDKDDVRKRSRVALGERVAGKVAEGKDPVIISGPIQEDARFSDVESLRDIRSSIVFPLILKGEVLGVLNANRTTNEEPFNASHLRHATIFGSQIAQALHNAKLYRELEQKILQIQEMHLQLVQSEKLAAVGQLAAGIAHEINNPLTGILGFAEFLLQGDNLFAEQREDVEEILSESKRVRDIVQNLLKFSRPRKPKMEPVAVLEVLKPVLRLVQYDFRHAHLAIKMNVSEDPLWVFGDAAQIEQVFLNIVTNARQAMEGKKDGVLEIQAKEAGQRVSIRFKDHGCGISPENLSRIFDPFFTTKPVGKGTGLGLSVSYGIIQQHKGMIRVESRPGAGSTFIVELPACKIPCPEITVGGKK
ncbi:MAG: response regulator [Elusimicrobia bacterium]|nr:response regulator [Elusimicrobiota bacterium]